MTSNEKFEAWWASPAAPFNYTVMDKASVRGIWDVAWNARLSDEDAAFLIADLMAGEEEERLHASASPNTRAKAYLERAERYAAVRRRLEGK